MKNTIITILALLLVIAVGIIVRLSRNTPEPNIDIEPETEEVLESEEAPLGVEIEEERSLSVGEAESVIVGTWQSVEDEQSVITFEANGTIRDVYAGGAINETGTYQVLDEAHGLPEEAVVGSGPFLRQTFGEEDYYYAIDEVTADSLVLIYLSRGNILEYSRVGE